MLTMLTQSFILNKILIRFFKFIFFNPFTYLLLIMDGFNPSQPSFYILMGMVFVIIMWLCVNLHRLKTKSFVVIQGIVSEKILIPGSGGDPSSCYIRFLYKGNKTILVNAPYSKYKAINTRDIYYFVFSSLEKKKLCWLFSGNQYSVGSDLEEQYVKLDRKEVAEIAFNANDVTVSQLSLHENERVVRWPWAPMNC